jgi:P-type conjugative transfer protein TrbJ
MKTLSMALALAAGTAVPIAATFPLPLSEARAMPVFDVTNYAQNLLQASRALEQINNQLRSLQNEAAMLHNMARNLERIDFPQLQQIKSAMQRMDELMGQAQAIDFKIGQLDQRVRAMFPGAGPAQSGDQQVAKARARLDAAMEAYRLAMGVQAQVAENVEEDSGLLSALVERSQGAAGALAAQQVASQLLALGVKQQFQLQQLMAAEYRGQALDRSRRAQAEQDGRAATQRFLGSGKAYTPNRKSQTYGPRRGCASGPAAGFPRPPESPAAPASTMIGTWLSWVTSTSSIASSRHSCGTSTAALDCSEAMSPS